MSGEDGHMLFCCPLSHSVCLSQCSKSCGEGVQTRDVRCLTPDKQPSFVCDSAHKPHPEQLCNPAPCNPSLGGCFVYRLFFSLSFPCFFFPSLVLVSSFHPFDLFFHSFHFTILLQFLSSGTSPFFFIIPICISLFLFLIYPHSCLFGVPVSSPHNFFHSFFLPLLFLPLLFCFVSVHLIVFPSIHFAFYLFITGFLIF